MADKVPHARPVIVFDPARLRREEEKRKRRRLIPAWILSGVIHVLLVVAFLLLIGSPTKGTDAVPLPVPPDSVQTCIDPQEEPEDPEPPVMGNPFEVWPVEPDKKPEPPPLPDAGKLSEIPLESSIHPSSGVGGGPAGVGDGSMGGEKGVPNPDGRGGLFGPPSSSIKSIFGDLGGRMFKGASRKKMVEGEGGSDQSEAAVREGLKWLAKHQAPDGRWSFGHFHQHGKCTCNGQSTYDDVAATAFGLLPFLGYGETHKGGADRANPDDENLYTKTVARGLEFLLAQQNPQTGEFHTLMYSHALATIAVCEAYAMTSDPRLRKPAQKALNYIVNAQSAEGGWRYGAGQPGFDTSVGGWQAMALKSGQMAGLDVPTKTLKACHAWLDAAADGQGGYVYSNNQRSRSHAMAGAGLLCRQYLGWGPRKPELVAGVKLLDQWGPAPNDIYYNYYATQVMHHMGGEPWKRWNAKMRDDLIAKQARNGHEKGSWNGLGGHAGRIMDTSMAILTLEVYYRHLPLYRREVGGDKALD